MQEASRTFEDLLNELEGVNEEINNYFEGDNAEQFTEAYYQTLKDKQKDLLLKLGVYKTCTACQWRMAKFEYKCEPCINYSNFEFDEE